MSLTRRDTYVFLCVIGVAVLLVLFFLCSPAQSAKYLSDSTLVATLPPDRSQMFAPTPGPSFLKGLWKIYYRLRPPLKGNSSFPVSEVRRCSIHGLLNQCHEISGVQFLIDKNVASGLVQFGSSNVLNGPQWVSAFTNAIRTGMVEWWDAKKGSFRKDNPVFIPVGANAVLVLPSERVRDFQAVQ